MAANLTPADVRWDHLLDTRLLHLTGITPPLSDGCRAIVVEACARARAAGIPISFDVNFRSKLWPAQEAGEFIVPLVQGVDLFFCGRGDAKNLLGLNGEAEDVRRLAKLTRRGCGADPGGRGRDRLGRQTDAARAGQTGDDHRPARRGDALVAGVIHGWLTATCAAFADGRRAGRSVPEPVRRYDLHNARRGGRADGDARRDVGALGAR